MRGRSLRARDRDIVHTAYTVRVTISDGSSVTVINPRDGLLHIGNGGGENFGPVELLLAAVGGCAAFDFTKVMAQRGHPLDVMDVEVSGQKAKDARLERVQVRYLVPADVDVDQGDLEVAMRLTSDVLCTVSRTLAEGSQVDHLLAPVSKSGTDGIEGEPAEAAGSLGDGGSHRGPSPAKWEGEVDDND